MNKSMKVVGVVAGLLLLGLVGYAVWRSLNGKLGAANAPVNSSFSTSTDSYLNYGTQDVVGTHIGTSTIGGNFPSPNVTSSFVSVIGRASQATYQIFIPSVTSTSNNLSVTVQGSNDYLCGTQAGSASSTTDVVQKNINWYDAMPYLIAKSNLTAFSNGSSSLILGWTNTTVGSSNILAFDNLDFQCLKLLVSASSTQPYIGLNTK